MKAPVRGRAGEHDGAGRLLLSGALAGSHVGERRRADARAGASLRSDRGVRLVATGARPGSIRLRLARAGDGRAHRRRPSRRARNADGHPAEMADGRASRDRACRCRGAHPRFRLAAAHQLLLARWRRETSRIVETLARRFGAHPGLVGWQTDNEYGCHGTTFSYGPEDLRAFRDWLRRRYQSARS